MSEAGGGSPEVGGRTGTGILGEMKEISPGKRVGNSLRKGWNGSTAVEEMRLSRGLAAHLTDSGGRV